MISDRDRRHLYRADFEDLGQFPDLAIAEDVAIRGRSRESRGGRGGILVRNRVGDPLRSWTSSWVNRVRVVETSSLFVGGR